MNEIMPKVEKATNAEHTLWITNLREDRHTDALQWTEHDAGELILTLSETQARTLYAKLIVHITRWDVS